MNESQPYVKRGDIGIDLVSGFADLLADAHFLPFRDSVFESAGIYTSLDHFSDPFKSLKEANRVIKKDLIIVIGNSDHWARAFSRESPDHFYKWNSDTLTQLLILSGFEKFKRVLLRLRRRRSFKTLMFEFLISFLFRSKSVDRFLSEVLVIKASCMEEIRDES